MIILFLLFFKIKYLISGVFDTVWYTDIFLNNIFSGGQELTLRGTGFSNVEIVIVDTPVIMISVK